MSVTIARVRDDEAFTQLRELLVEYERSLPPDLRHGVEPELEAVRQAYAEPNAAFLARLRAEGIGCVALIRRDRSTGVIQRLYAKPEHRRLGAGRALVQAAVDYARADGCERVVLDTHAARLPAAYALYRSFGFVDCAAYESVSYACPTYMELHLRHQ